MKKTFTSLRWRSIVLFVSLLWGVQAAAAKSLPKIVVMGAPDVEMCSRSNTLLETEGGVVRCTSRSGVSGVYWLGNWDLTGYNRVRFKVRNLDARHTLEMALHLQEELQSVSMRKRVPKGTMTNPFTVKPDTERVVEFLLPPVIEHPEVDSCFVRMQNSPYTYRDQYAYNLDLSHIKVVKIFAHHHSANARYEVSEVEILPGKRPKAAPWMQLDKEAFFPFIDRYGQFKHRDWPGKTHSDASLQAEREHEERDLAAHGGATDWSRYGGWKQGPKLEATGHFRVEKVDGKWWMVDPEGYLFWSHGVVRVTTSTGVTPLDNRRYYFEELPEQGSDFEQFYYTHDALLKPYYTARKIQSTYDFSSANAYRKYGPDYRAVYADLAHRRLKSWGLNTIANSSDKDICMMGRTAYTDRVEIHSAPIAGTGGWWPMADPFDASFAQTVREQLMAHKEQLDDPWCLGFFVDNEIKWGDRTALALAVLKAPATQVAKQRLVEWLQEKYTDVTALNQAWGTKFASWEALLAHRKGVSKRAHRDLAVFNQRIIETYFATIRHIFKEIAPQKLYLGCRFAGSNADVLAIAARYCDVLSYNIYRCELHAFALPQGIDKPVMIGEFHFGALDRGLFHPGLVYAENQQERAQMYYNYVRSALEHPLLIGTHWHQFSDQAATGRFDGENFQVGFTDICDKPYYETVEKIREVGYQLYTIRSQAQ